MTPGSNFIVCNDSVYKYFVEYMNTFIIDGYILLTVGEFIRLNVSVCDEVLLLQRGDWFPTHLLSRCTKVRVVNTEQLCYSPVIERVIRELAELSMRTGYAVEVIDYSYSNKAILDAHRVRCSVHEYITPQAEIDYLSSLIARSVKKYDLGFVGYINPRRNHVLEKLRLKGFTILITHTFGKERDTMLAQCRAILNIHCEEHFQIFESIRCNRWIASGMRVISETSTDTPVSDLLDQYTYDELCELPRMIVIAT